MSQFDYSVFFDHSLEMLCLANHEGYFVKLNPQWEQVLGWSVEELCAKPFIEFVHPTDREKTIAEASKLGNPNHQTVRFENRYQTKDGNYKWLEWMSTSQKDFIYAAARDITSYKEQTRYFNEMQRVAKIGYWHIDMATGNPAWSDLTYDIHEIPRGTPVDMENAINFYPPEVIEDVQQTVGNAMEKGHDWDREWPFVTAKGNRLWVRALGRPTIEDGKVTDIHGIFQDVTARKEKELRLAYIVEHSGDGVFDWDIPGEYEYMSPRFWEILGYEPHEKKHHPSEWQSLIFEEDLKLALENFEKHVASKGEHPFWQEARYRHKNGSIVWIICQGKVIEWGSNGEPIRMIGTHTDITQLKLAQTQLHENLKLASLGEMAGGIAHEINNPLAIISGAAYLLRCHFEENTGNRKEMEDCIDKIDSTTERISSIITGMKKLLRADDKEFRNENIDEIIKNTVSLCRENLSYKCIEVTENLNCNQELLCNATQISQVILNLINNAADATSLQGEESEKWIKINSSFKAPNIELTIEDSGPGIAEEIRDKIKDPFFTTKSDSGGTGLGLSISHQIITEHRGDLTLDKNSPITKFIITIPVNPVSEN